MKVLLRQVSDWQRREIIELTTLEQLLEIIAVEDWGIWTPAIVLSRFPSEDEKELYPGVGWKLIIYDGYLE